MRNNEWKTTIKTCWSFHSSFIIHHSSFIVPLLRRLLFLQCQHRGKLVRRRQSLDQVAVYYERRRGFDANSVSFFDVCLDSAFHAPVVQAGLETVDIEAQGASVRLQVLARVHLLIAK